MKAVHVLCGIDSLQNALGIDLGRQWQLHEDAIHAVVAVELKDQLQQGIGIY